jgi:divalent metal cation (Fe/Co/Zn/Cd) transporter
MSTAERERLRGRARGLALATVAWNVVEAVVAIASGAVADSIALVGFGLDSTIEVASATVILWQFAGEHHEDRERRALRLIGWSFFALAAYVGAQALWSLASRTEPEASTVGIVLAAVSLVVMPVLAAAKRRTGAALDSRAVVADAAETRLCAWLSLVLLVGLLLNAAVGWWWADPLAALAIAALAVREGREAWAGEHCC